MNNAPINSSAINEAYDRVKYAAASIVAGTVATGAAAGILFIAATLVPAASIAAVGAQKIAPGEADIVCDVSVVAGGSAIYVEKGSEAAAQSVAMVSVQPTLILDSAASIAGTSAAVALLGDGVDLASTATVMADAGVSISARAGASGSAALQTVPSAVGGAGASIIGGSVRVDAIPSYEYQAGHSDHDGHTRVSAGCALAVAGDPLFKPGACLIQPTATVETAPAVATFGASAATGSCAMGADAQVEAFYSASIPAPRATVSATAHLRLQAVALAQPAAAIIAIPRYAGYARAAVGPRAEISAVGGIGMVSRSAAESGATLGVDVRVDRVAGAAIEGASNIQASMVSNPRAHAIQRRTYKVAAEIREIRPASQGRTIKVMAA